MKRITIFLMALLPVISLLISCESDSTIGSSIVQDQLTVTIDSAFTVKAQTVEIDSVQSRTVTKLIGRIDAGEYGRLSSEFVTQFMPASSIDTSKITVNGIDSLVLELQIVRGEFVGDSVAPLGLNVYKLNKMLPSPIYSNFDPSGYYSPDDLLGSTVYNVTWDSWSMKNSADYTSVRIPMPIETARELYSDYLKNPEVFSSPTEFAQKVFPGIYIQNTFGSGRVTRVQRTLMTMYYHYKYTNPESGNDTIIYRSGNYFATTPEVISNNNVSMHISDKIMQRVAQGENIVMGPAGLEVEMEFPAAEILASYRRGNNAVKVLNSCTFSVPGETIENDFGILPPKYLLLVLKRDKAKFFANNALPDNVTSFYATYDSNTGLYNFGDMKEYLMTIIDKNDLSPEDYTFTITPVSANFEINNSSSSSSYYYGYYYGGSSNQQTLSMLTPYMASPVMARINTADAKIKLTFTSQSLQ